MQKRPAIFPPEVVRLDLQQVRRQAQRFVAHLAGRHIDRIATEHGHTAAKSPYALADTGSITGDDPPGAGSGFYRCLGWLSG
jgi:hypothetical protein